MRLKALSPLSSALPTEAPVSLERLLARHVELQHTATRRQVATMATHTQCPNTKPRLQALSADDEETGAYRAEVKRKRRAPGASTDHAELHGPLLTRRATTLLPQKRGDLLVRDHFLKGLARSHALKCAPLDEHLGAIGYAIAVLVDSLARRSRASHGRA